MQRRNFLTLFGLSSFTSSLSIFFPRPVSNVEPKKLEQKITNKNHIAQIQNLSINSVDVRSFGPLISGITNLEYIIKANTETIQTAINIVGQNGGGSIYIPQGIYQISPLDLNTQEPCSLLINYDNITLIGDGISKTILQSRGDYALINGRVVRGHGILIKGTQDPYNPRKNVTIKNLELNGSVKGFTGQRNWPADPNNGDGWDVTHKGIALDFNTNLDNINLDSIYVHDFRGELIYGGGGGIGKVTISKTQLKSSNASLLSLDADLTVTECEFSETATAWVENAPISPNKSYQFYKCIFKDSIYQGLVIGQGNFPDNHNKTITNCSFSNSPDGVCVFNGVSNLIIKNNIFTDCKNSFITSGNNQKIEFSFNEINGITVGVTAANLAGNLQNILIKNNVLTCSDVDKRACVYYWGDLQNIVIEDNIFENCRTPEQSSDINNERPLFRNNQYLNVERRDFQGKSNFWQEPPYILEPKYEEILVANNTNNRSIQVNMSIDKYVDGQEVIIMVDSSRGNIKFPKKSSTIQCQKDRYLKRKDDKIRLKFQKADSKWYEIAYSSHISSTENNV
ncbi:hypothetical protein NIES37_15470 [Tolypothrix tenuis PCC 7101]|uniref:Right handed beta helix domain-containing protein n=1 Tax=Tolypothrix tenuis PCC 7101 TaxID=231146 RepID=A0A1Z4MVX5_9CYAN|nr:right-handed parallel beta-helix repeat-containing protein [Aulosira sp. FACHB-113]BAY97605.1 hypothetical protein NIES37_15470 [Tolypothrix tenuis PCC 7101]BAZ71887.1 hypothetical protein NIES50_04360 [Aulosira laxa NIES-50]